MEHVNTDARQRQMIALITNGAFFAFFIFGFMDNLKGPALPALLQDLSLNYAQGGQILFGAYLGFFFATLFTGPLADAAGKKAIIFICCACLLVGVGGFSQLSTIWPLTLLMTIIGVGLGSIEVGANLMIVDLYHAEKARYLNLLAFFHGLGAMVAPIYAGRLLSMGFSWRSVYEFSVILVGVLLVYFLLVKYPAVSTTEGSGGFDLKKFGKSVFTVEMLLFYAVIALYVAAEIGLAAWLVEFLQTAKTQSVMRSSLYLSLFFAMITAGRFLGSFVVEKIGYLKITFWASLGGIACMAAGIFGPPQAALFLPLTGFFFSIIFPTITAAVSHRHQENVGTVLGILFAFAGIGGAFGPWLVGVCNQWFGVVAGFGMNLVFCLLMCVGCFVLLQRTPAK